uniref:SAM-dependent methyltransferase n=1 Tax=Elaeophora elaphi TaxID=1147741 RepID=A0A158Q8P5_9BILA
MLLSIFSRHVTCIQLYPPEKYGRGDNPKLRTVIALYCLNQMGVAGMIAAGTVATSAVAVTAVCAPFVTPALRKICIPYVPATPQQLQNVATALSACPTKVSPLVDMGSGDGRVCIQLVAGNSKFYGPILWRTNDFQELYFS